MLRNMTQQELGLRCGFSKTSAGSRIRHYELGMKSPKDEILHSLAKALDIDISAISEVSTETDIDIIRILFELEERYNLNIQKKDGDFSFSFDNLKQLNKDFYYLLDTWFSAKTKISENTTDPNSSIEYQLWKSRFPLDCRANEKKQKKLVNAKYEPLKEKAQQTNFSLTTVKDFAVLLEKMIRAGISLELDTQYIHAGTNCAVISFSDSQLLVLSDVSNQLFAEFLCALDILEKHGISIAEDQHTFEETTYSDYYIESSPLATLLSSINELQQRIINRTDNDELFMYNYENTLKMYDHKIEDLL